MFCPWGKCNSVDGLVNRTRCKFTWCVKAKFLASGRRFIKTKKETLPPPLLNPAKSLSFRIKSLKKRWKKQILFWFIVLNNGWMWRIQNAFRRFKTAFWHQFTYTFWYFDFLLAVFAPDWPHRLFPWSVEPILNLYLSLLILNFIYFL